jgi:phage protein D
MKALFDITVGDLNITERIRPVLLSLRIEDKAGHASDRTRLELSDTDGQLLLPSVGAVMKIGLGWEHTGLEQVFEGAVDEVRSRGNRGSGRTLVVSARGTDMLGTPKTPQARHFDSQSLHTILAEAGGPAGIREIVLSEDLESVVLPYAEMRDESFIAFGERLAREVGGTFKIVGQRATMYTRSPEETASGEPIPSIAAIWGDNLIDWDIAPVLGRPRYKSSRVRYFDADSGTWKDVSVQTGIEGTDAEYVDNHAAADEEEAQRRAESASAEVARDAGEGWVQIVGNTSAQAEGICIVAGTRPGIDGSYRIDAVEHEYSRSGFTTRLDMKEPGDGAGADERDETEDE